MMLPFGSQSRLDKLLDSLRAHIFMSSENENAFILKVKEAVYNDFIDEAHKLEATKDDGHNKDD